MMNSAMVIKLRTFTKVIALYVQNIDTIYINATGKYVFIISRFICVLVISIKINAHIPSIIPLYEINFNTLCFSIVETF